MTIKNLPEYQLLANIIQTTYGKTSQKSTTHFINMSLILDNRITVRFQSIVNFGHQNVFLELKKRYREEALDVIEKTIETLAQEYKTAAKESLVKDIKKTIKLKVSDPTITESIEYVSTSLYSPNKTAFYRVGCIVEIS